MISTIAYTALSTQIVLQLSCAYFAFKTYKLINHGNFWWLMGSGFVLMAVRRVTALMTFNTDINLVALLDKLGLPFLITVLLFFGMLRFYQAGQKIKKHQDETDSRLEQLRNKLNKL